tara:strand:- start:23631 stop:24020 length:390 start_codon:yes stop_codon:yes gene_type:complete
MEIEIPVSVGELLDKLSIVEIKRMKIKNKEKLAYLNLEYELLNEKVKNIRKISEQDFDNFYSSLMEINSKLWDIEDEIRALEGKKQFDQDFIDLARNVYITNDMRFEVKSDINKYFGSTIVEQKELKNY